MSEIYIPSSTWESEKQKILKEAKDAAWHGIPKTASVYMKEQDPYPSPYLNISDYQMPRSMVEIFKWCRYFYKFDSLIGGAVNALARFPVTDIIFEDMEATKNDDSRHDSPTLEMYQQTFQDLKIQDELLKIGIDYWLYGNCFVLGEFEEMSEDPEAYSDIRWKRIFRLDPSRVAIDLDPLTQEKTYKWEIPAKIRRIVREKRPKEKYDAIPEFIRKAVREKKSVVLNSKNIYHFSREGESGDGSVWGTPLILNVMKQIAYRNLLRQAQEAIAREHVVPFRIYYLNSTDRMDPQTNWNNVASAFGKQLEMASRDPNYKVVSPIPVDVINLGGQGRALMLTPEIDQLQAEILAGMGVPREFIFGGVSYSAASISLRTLENQFITYRLLLIDFMNNFLIKRMAEVRGEWRSHIDNPYLVTAGLTDLKMQDDVQQKQMIINLNAARKVSDKYMYNMLGIDQDKMKAELNIEIFEKMDQERQMQLYQLETSFMVQQYQMQYNAQLAVMQQNLQQQMGVNMSLVEQEEQPDNQQESQDQHEQPANQDKKDNKSKQNKKESPKDKEEKSDKAAGVIDFDLVKLGSSNEITPMQQLMLESLVTKLANLNEIDQQSLLSKVSDRTKYRIISYMEKCGSNPHAPGASASRNIKLSNMTELERLQALKKEMPELAQDSAEHMQEIAMLPVPEVLPQRRDLKI